MSNSQRENIIANVVTALGNVTTGNGYNNTLVSVQRFQQDGLSVASVPCAVVNFDQERKVVGPLDRVTCTLDIGIDIWAVHDPVTVSGSTATLLDSLAADVEKAVMQDTSRGGYARDCFIETVMPFRLTEGMPVSGMSLRLTCTHVHDISDPYLGRN